MELFRQHPIGVAILDIEMPVMSGIDTAQIIHSEAPDCAILFLTAYDRFEYAQNAIRVRALEYLLKPYDDEELLARWSPPSTGRCTAVPPRRPPSPPTTAPTPAPTWRLPWPPACWTLSAPTTSRRSRCRTPRGR